MIKGLTYAVRIIWPYILCGPSSVSGRTHMIRHSDRLIYIRSNLTAAEKAAALKAAVREAERELPKIFPPKLKAGGRSFSVSYCPCDEIGAAYRVDYEQQAVFIDNSVDTFHIAGVIDTIRVEIEEQHKAEARA
jgi:hypothetical protein